MADGRRAAAGATAALAVAALIYTGVAWARTRAFARRRAEAGTGRPSITILKPLHGDQPHLRANLDSFRLQEYPDYTVIYGARREDDAALGVARNVAAADPRCLVVSADAATPHYANPKVDTLAALVPHATGDLLVFADDDMHVTPDYLQAIAAPFDDAQVGAVTCLYRGRAGDSGLASQLGAQANHQYFAPSALVAESLLGMRFGFGATIAVRRSLFEAAGGLDALGAHLADDARLCALIAAGGHQVVLSRYVVENVVNEPSLRALWQHEVRWARTQRLLEPAGFLGMCLTYPIALALLHLLVTPRRGPALALLGAALAVRGALAGAARDAFGVTQDEPGWMVPLRDLLGFAVWAASFAARDVTWSGDALAIARDGTIAE